MDTQTFRGGTFQVLFQAVLLLQKLKEKWENLERKTTITTMTTTTTKLSCLVQAKQLLIEIKKLIHVCGKKFLSQRTEIDLLKTYFSHLPPDTEIVSETSCYPGLKEIFEDIQLRVFESQRLHHLLFACERLLREMWTQKILVDSLSDNFHDLQSWQCYLNENRYISDQTDILADLMLDSHRGRLNGNEKEKHQEKNKEEGKKENKENKENKETKFSLSFQREKGKGGERKKSLEKKNGKRGIKQDDTDTYQSPRKKRFIFNRGDTLTENQNQNQNPNQNQNQKSQLKFTNTNKINLLSLQRGANAEKTRRAWLRKFQDQNTQTAAQIDHRFNSLILSPQYGRPNNYNQRWHSQLQELLEDLLKFVPSLCQKLGVLPSQDKGTDLISCLKMVSES